MEKEFFTTEENINIANRIIPIWNALYKFTTSDFEFKIMRNSDKRELIKIEQKIWNIYKKYGYEPLVHNATILNDINDNKNFSK